MKNKKIKIESIVIATTLLLSSSFGVGISSINAKADYLDSATIIIDEELGDINLLTRTEGSYTADMVHTMTYDRLWRLNENGQFVLDLVESWNSTSGGGSMNAISQTDGIRYAPGWEVQPPFYVEMQVYNPDNPITVTCKLRENIQFQNGEALTVGSLVNLVNFAKLQPQNTLIYQTWAPVVITPIDDYRFYFVVNTQDFNLGIMDVMYNLASPHGSIVYIEDGILESGNYPIGTGAYELEEVEPDGVSVSFERWEDWWNTQTVPTQYVTFQYTLDTTTAEVALLTDNANVAVIRDSFYDDISSSNPNDYRGEYWTERYGKEYFLIEENPFALFFNTNAEQSIFGNFEYRQAVSVMLNKDDLRECGGLDFDSNDFWSYLTDADMNTELEDTGWLYAEELINDAGSIEFGSAINVIVYNNSYFSNEIYWQYYGGLYAGLQQNLSILAEEYGCTINYIGASESEMAAYEVNGNYDIILKEIDLHNVNSAYNTLYGKGNTDIDDWLDIASITINEGSFMQAHAAAQYYNYKEEAYITTLGWQKKAVIRNQNVSGISVCESFNPMGDASTLDFRFIAVTANG